MAERTISETKNIGLRGIPVADTMISAIDGERGMLIYRGFSILDLIQYSTFEEVAYLLLFGDLPNRGQLKSFQESLSTEKKVPEALLRSMEVRPKSAHPMDVLQSCVAMLADYDPQIRVMEKEADLAKAKRLIAKIPTIVAAWDRIRKNKSPVQPDPSKATRILEYITPPTKRP